MTDQRAFTLQLYPGGKQHKHTCELCADQFNCADMDCPGPDTMDTCFACCERFDCPQCGADALDSMNWSGDDGVGSEKVITRFHATCPECSTQIAYQDNNDGRGPLRIMWKPSDLTAPQHIRGASFKGVPFPMPEAARGTAKGTVEWDIKAVFINKTPGAASVQDRPVESFVDAGPGCPEDEDTEDDEDEEW